MATASQIVYGIKLISDVSGVVNGVNTVKQAVRTLPAAYAQASARLRAFSLGNGNFSAVAQSDLQSDRLAKRRRGLEDSEERLNRANEIYTNDLSNATDPAKTDAERAKAQEHLLVSERYLHNARVTYARKLYEYKLALERQLIDETRKMEKNAASASRSLESAQAKQESLGLNGGEGTNTAKNVLQVVNNADKAIFQVSSRLKAVLPQALQDALNDMGAKEQKAMQMSLKRAIQEAEEKKRIAINAQQDMSDALRELQQAEAASNANPANRTLQENMEGAKAVYDARRTLAEKAAAESIAADNRAFQVAEKTSNDLKNLVVKNSNDQAGAIHKATQAQEQFGASLQKAFNYSKRLWNDSIMAVNKFVNAARLAFQAAQQLVQTMAISVAAPLGAALKEGFTSAVDFEQQMAKVRKAVDGIDSASFDVLEKRIRNLAKITPTSAEQIGVFAEQAGQIGIEGMPAVYRFINLMNKLAIGTDVATESISEDMGRIASAFGMNLNTEEGMQGLERLASVMDMVAKKTATDMSGIVSAMKDAAVVGPQLKIPAKSIAAMVGVLISAGVDASAAGTNLSRFFTQTLKNADKFSQMMQGYVRVSKDAQGNLIQTANLYDTTADVVKEINAHPVEVLTDALSALNQATDADKAKALREFMETAGFVGARVGAMAGSYEKLQEMLSAVNDEWDEQTTLAADYAAMLMTTDSQMKIFNNNVKDLGMEMASAIMPTINQLLQYAIPVIQMLGQKFSELDGKTKLLIVGIPLLVVALTPVVMVAVSVGQAFTFLAMSMVTLAMSIGQGVFAVLGMFGRLLKGSGILTAVGKALGLVSTSATAVAGGTTVASVGLGTMIKNAIGLVTPLGWIVAGVTAVIGTFKLLTKFGLNVSKYFLKLADNARSWGEKMMATYGQGLAGGAARVISGVITKIASMIASFFEAHSPPEKGPLSTIDQWGKGLMDTYLKGFFLADFDILDSVGDIIRNGLEVLDSLNGGDGSGLSQMFIDAREAISQLIETFNRTGEIAQDVIARIGEGLGSLQPEVQKLTEYWLEYQRIQKSIADLEKRKKASDKAYNDEIARISAMNISAEEKAARIRDAQLKHQNDQRAYEEEKQNLEDQEEASKDKLDWQKAYVEELIKGLDILKQAKKETGSGSGDIGSGIEWKNPSIGVDTSDAQKAVEDLGEEFNQFKQKVEDARVAVNMFLSGFRGEEFGEGMNDKTLFAWAKNDPEGYQAALDMYNLGKDIGKLWNDLKTKGENLAAIYERLTTKTEKVNKPTSEFIKTIQKYLDLVPEISFTPLEGALTSLDSALAGLKQAFRNTGAAGQLFQLWLKGVAMIIGLVVSFIGTLVVSVINGVGSIISWVIQIVAGAIAGIGTFIAGIITSISSFITTIGALIQGDWEGVVKGVLGLAEGWITQLWGLISAAFSLFAGFLLGIASTIIRIGGDIIAYLVGIFRGEAAKQSIKAWCDKAIADIQTWYTNIKIWFNTALATIQGFFTDLIAKAPSIVNGLGPALGAAFERQFDPLISKVAGYVQQVLDLIAKITNNKINIDLPTVGTSVVGWGNYGSGSGGAGGSCFVGETLVSTPQGMRMIMDLGVGDKVLVREATGKLVEAAVSVTHLNFRTDLVTVSTGDLAVHCSPNHRFLTVDGWKEASTLHKGDLLVTATGAAPVADVCDYPGFFPIYNLTVDHPDHTYMVEGIVVHNKKTVMASGGVALGPTHALIGEGGEAEVVAPLSKLPSLFHEIYGEQAFQGATGSNQPLVINVNHPVVREEQDIDKIATEIERRWSKRASAQMRYRR